MLNLQLLALRDDIIVKVWDSDGAIGSLKINQQDGGLSAAGVVSDLLHLFASLVP